MSHLLYGDVCGLGSSKNVTKLSLSFHDYHTVYWAVIVSNPQVLPNSKCHHVDVPHYWKKNGTASFQNSTAHHLGCFLQASCGPKIPLNERNTTCNTVSVHPLAPIRIAEGSSVLKQTPHTTAPVCKFLLGSIFQHFGPQNMTFCSIFQFSPSQITWKWCCRAHVSIAWNWMDELHTWLWTGAKPAGTLLEIYR